MLPLGLSLTSCFTVHNLTRECAAKPICQQTSNRNKEKGVVPACAGRMVDEEDEAGWGGERGGSTGMTDE